MNRRLYVAAASRLIALCLPDECGMALCSCVWLRVCVLACYNHRITSRRCR